MFTYLSKSVNQKFVNVDISCKVVLKYFVFNYGYLIYPTYRSLVISRSRYVLVFLLTSCNQFSQLCFVYKIIVFYFVTRLYLIVWFWAFCTYIILRVSLGVIGFWISSFIVWFLDFCYNDAFMFRVDLHKMCDITFVRLVLRFVIHKDRDTKSIIGLQCSQEFFKISWSPRISTYCNRSHYNLNILIRSVP